MTIPASSESFALENKLFTTSEWSLWNRYLSGQLTDEVIQATKEHSAFVEAHPWVHDFDEFQANWALARKYIGEELDKLQEQYDHDVQAIRDYNQRIREDKASVLPFVYEPELIHDDHSSLFSPRRIHRHPDGTLELPRRSYADGRWNVFLNHGVKETKEYKERQKALNKLDRCASKKAAAQRRLDMAETLCDDVKNLFTVEKPAQHKRYFVELLDALLCPRFNAETPQGRKRPRGSSSQVRTQNQIYDWIIPSPDFESTGDYYHVHRIQDVLYQPEFQDSFISSSPTKVKKRPMAPSKDLYVFFHHRRNMENDQKQARSSSKTKQKPLSIEYKYTRVNGGGLSESFFAGLTDDGRLFMRGPMNYVQGLQRIMKWAYDNVESFLKWAHRQIGQCSFCRRPLSSETSIERGLGPTCAKRQSRLVHLMT
jgi:hypothetical protein